MGPASEHAEAERAINVRRMRIVTPEAKVVLIDLIGPIAARVVPTVK